MSYPDQQTAIDDMSQQVETALRTTQDDYIKALTDRYSEFEARLSADILKIHSEMFPGGTADYGSFVQFQGDAKLFQAIQNELHRLNVDIHSSLYDELVQQYKDAYNGSAWVLDQSTPPNIDVSYDLPNENMLRQIVSTEWSGAMFSQRIGVINDFMAKDIQQEVIQGMMSGDSTKDLADRISNIIGDENSAYTYRANMIARTEMMRASNLAANAVLESNDDILDTWTWVSRPLMSPRLCEYCAERSGLTYEEVQALMEDDSDQDDMGIDPPIHPHCACIWSPKVKSWSDLLGDASSDTLKPTSMVVPNPNGDGYQSAPERQDLSQWLTENVTDQDRGNL